ncbi:MAG TPA: transposase [Flavitalea sp.]|nr:transposase [Flavitalea sp.]
MEPNNKPHVAKKQRKPKEVIQLLRGYESSEGISVREYCKMIGVDDSTFYNWRKKYSQALEPQADFIPLQITGIKQSSASLQAEVRVIKFYGPLCLEQLKALLS